MSLAPHLNRIPPFLCAAIAKGRNPPLSPREIATRSGIPLRTVERISGKIMWDSIKVGVAHRFALACGVDLLRQSRTKNYLRTTTRQASVPLPNLNARQRAAMHKAMQETKKAKTP